MLGVANGSQNNFIPMIIIPGSPQSFTWLSEHGQLQPNIPLSHDLAIGHRKLQRGLHVQSKTIFNFF